MTVAELIAWLEGQPAGMRVFHHDYRNGRYKFYEPTPTVDLVLPLENGEALSGAFQPDAIEAVVL